jgi:hypothetical protein
VSRTLAANLTSPHDRLHATWGEFIAGDNFADPLGIICLPDMKECAVIMSLWPDAVTRECKDNGIDSMFREHFFQTANDYFSFGKDYKTKIYAEENKHP